MLFRSQWEHDGILNASGVVSVIRDWSISAAMSTMIDRIAICVTMRWAHRRHHGKQPDSTFSFLLLSATIAGHLSWRNTSLPWMTQVWAANECTTNSTSSALSAETLSWHRNMNKDRPEHWQMGDWKVSSLPPSFGAGADQACYPPVVNPDDEVGFTVHKGHAYCESCHVRLRMPKCRKCKKSIRPGDQAVEAMGGKWCWNCFVCAVSLRAPLALLLPSLTCVLSAVESRLTTLNFTNIRSSLFAESVTVSFLFRAWTDFWHTHAVGLLFLCLILPRN